MIVLLALVFSFSEACPPSSPSGTTSGSGADAVQGGFTTASTSTCLSSGERLIELIGKGWVDRAGICALVCGDLQVVGMDASISVETDETALELGRLNTVEGRFPEAADEIVLQESWKARLEGVEVGDTLTLLTETGERDYIVSGFLENYTSSGWTRMIPLLVRKLPAALW